MTSSTCRAALLVTAVATSLSTMAAQDSLLALTHVAIIDVRTGRTLPDQTVVVSGNRILTVGSSVAVPSGARQVDLSGKFIVPGFFDMHAHAAPQADEQSRRRTIETELLRRVREGVLRTPERVRGCRRAREPNDPTWTRSSLRNF
jgi:imidazolonepropionase-like amidohydrolase